MPVRFPQLQIEEWLFENLIRFLVLFLDKIREDKNKYLEIFRKYYSDIEEINISRLIESIIENDPELYIFIDKINYAFYDEEYSFIRGET